MRSGLVSPAKTLLRQCRVIDGRTPRGNHLLRILYGHHRGAFMHYVKKLAYGHEVLERKTLSTSLFGITRTARAEKCDLALVFGPSRLQSLGLFSDYYFLPQWVFGKFTLDRETVYIGNSPSRRRDIRKLSESNFSYRITTDKDELMHFYRDMYLPTMDESHGDAAIRMPAEEMLTRAESGDAELVLISKDSGAVAGSLLVYDEGRPRLLSMGVLQADRELFRRGAGTAIYLFSFQHLLVNGFSSVDAGRTRPFLNDGTLYFKKRLGLELTHGTSNGFYLRAFNASAGVREFLSSNPFVHSRRGRLAGAALVAGDDSELPLQLLMPGLDELTMIKPGKADARSE